MLISIFKKRFKELTNEQQQTTINAMSKVTDTQIIQKHCLHLEEEKRPKVLTDFKNLIKWLKTNKNN